MEGKTVRGVSSPAKPALHIPEPLSTTKATGVSSPILRLRKEHKKMCMEPTSVAPFGVTRFYIHLSIHVLGLAYSRTQTHHDVSVYRLRHVLVHKLTRREAMRRRATSVPICEHATTSHRVASRGRATCRDLSRRFLFLRRQTPPHFIKPR